jgi:dihydrodipicolinate synthase/N-acetylneuraminate lyase
MKDLGRLITAMVTPFDSKGKVDYDQAIKLALACLKSGSDGLVLSGTTGESLHCFTKRIEAVYRDQSCGRQARFHHRRHRQ